MEIMTILENSDVLQNILILGGVTVLGFITYSYLKGVVKRVNGDNNSDDSQIRPDDTQMGSHGECGSDCGSEFTIKDGSRNESIKFNWVKVREEEVQCVPETIDKEVQTDLIGDDIGLLEYKVVDDE